MVNDNSSGKNSKSGFRHAGRAMVLAGLLLTGCAGESEPLAKAFKFKADPVEPQAFVKAARVDPAKLDYIPVGFEETSHKTAVKTPTQAKADIDSASAAGAAAQSRVGGKTPNPAAAKLKKPRKPRPDAEEQQN